jgi:hypothetical protein
VRHANHDNVLVGYRAGRVRALFSLPDRLQYLYSGPLAYVELFTTFDDPISSIHQMHTVSPDCQHGRRRSLIVPLSSIVMGCHLAPLFNQFNIEQLDDSVDVLATGRRFFLNHFHNYFFFLFVRYWRRLC